MSKVFFLDFDGTVCKKDLVEEMVLKFCRDGWQDLNKRWEQGQLSTEQCANLTFQLLTATRQDILKLMDNMELDDYFADFAKICRKRNYPLYILSDGYIELIHYVLARYNLDEIPVYANHIAEVDGKFIIQCIHQSDQCDKCGTCKKEILHQLKEDGQIIYVGDGHSDMCVSHEADVVFAKGTLLKYCLKNKLPVVSYRSFKEIIDWLNT